MIKYLILALTFIIVSVIILFDPFKFSQDTKNAIVPLATLALAFAALLTIIYSQGQESRRKRETIIDEIIEWASEGRRIFAYGSLQWTAPSDRRASKSELVWITAKKSSVVIGSKMFRSKLLPAVKDAVANLDLLNDWLENTAGSQHPEDLKEKCKESFIKVFELSSNLKIELNS
jgi:hypothetical protein